MNVVAENAQEHVAGIRPSCENPASDILRHMIKKSSLVFRETFWGGTNMNTVQLVGRLTVMLVRFTSSGTAVGSFTLRLTVILPNNKIEREADFISCDLAEGSWELS